MKNAAAFAGQASRIETTVAFLLDRRQAVGVSPLGRRSCSAYVWQRVFLKGKERRG